MFCLYYGVYMAIKNIVAVVCGMDEEYPFQIIQGINDYAREHSINVSYFAAFGGIVDSEDFDNGEYSIYNLPDYSKFDGALLLTNTFSNPDVRNKIIDKVKAADLPSVIFECKDYEEFYDVSINNYSVMKKLVNHLINDHGAKVFNFISGPSANPEAKERYRAFRDALKENGLEFDEENRFHQGHFRSYDGVKAIENFEKSGMSMPDAFVCANDSMALTAMSRLQDMGYKIPDDVIITGFDNTFNARFSSPVLTTVKRPLYYSGTKACSLLDEITDGKDIPRSTSLEAIPVLTESCGCNELDEDDIRDFKRSTFQRFERSYAHIHMLNRLIAGLAGSENINECVDSIEQMLRMINCSHFNLCLVKDWEHIYNTIDVENGENTYPPLMTAPLVWDSGVRRTVKQFPSKRLFPEPFTTGGNISYFIPLHFNQRILGYYIFINNDFPIQSILCHTMTMSIGNAIENISKLNVLDPLTKIYNRNGFNKNAEFIFKECANERRPLSICFIDMDGLKKINDTYGHKEGDFAIKSLASAIESACGSVDVCGRFGGDEFVAVGRGFGFIKRFTNKLTKTLEEINEESGKPYKVEASVGYISTTPLNSDTLFDLIEQADRKMYEVKKEKYSKQ